jgi:hypothetical protein
VRNLFSMILFGALAGCVGACQTPSEPGAREPGTQEPDIDHGRDPSDIDPLAAENGIIPHATLYPETVPTVSNIDWDAFPRLLTSTSPVEGRLHWVSTEGDDGGDGSVDAPFATIGRGLQEATAGDWVVVRGGEYTEAPDGEYRALLFESDKAGVTITSYQGETVVLRPGAQGINYGLDIGASDVCINGIDFHGFPNAMAILGRPGLTVRNVVLSNAEFIIDPPGSAEGIDMVADNGGDPVVEGVLFHRVSVVGASIGIQCNFGPCNGVRFEGVYVDNGDGEGSGADTIAVESGNNIVILDTEVTNAGADGIDLKASDVLVVGAFVHDVKRNGLKLWRGGDVIDSVVTGTGADAAVVFDMPGRYRLLNSVVAHHNWNGLSSYVMTVGYDNPGEYDVALINNVFYRTAGAVFVNASATLRVENNAFAEASNRIAVEGPGPNGRLAQVGYDDDPSRFEDFGWGSGNLLGVDPEFVDPDGGDFHLTDSSPLIDAGAPASDARERTLDGHERTAGAAIDIGAFEH